MRENLMSGSMGRGWKRRRDVRATGCAPTRDSWPPRTAHVGHRASPSPYLDQCRAPPPAEDPPSGRREATPLHHGRSGLPGGGGPVLSRDRRRSFLVGPDTLARWHRSLLERRRGRARGGPVALPRSDQGEDLPASFPYERSLASAGAVRRKADFASDRVGGM